MRSLSDEAREARHGAILDEATIEFMRAGVSSAELIGNPNHRPMAVFS
jgi:hypothetical protein